MQTNLDMKKKQKKQGDKESNKKENPYANWTQEEDGILKDQIGIHGTEKWMIIASKLKGKTTRQCRRRWFSYLNADVKKGVWSPDEDKVLCETQKMLGNRWTEIAKVIRGRTDNAVKNRFSALCRKRETYAALAKENNIPYIDPNNIRNISHHGHDTAATSESTVPVKSMRSHLQNGISTNPQPRTLFAELAQNSNNVNNLQGTCHVSNAKSNSSGQYNNSQGTFLKEDVLKIRACGQTEFLSSLAQKVEIENIKKIWMVLQEFPNRTKGSDIVRHKIQDLPPVILKDMVEELKSSNDRGHPCSRKINEDSPGSSEYSTVSTLLSQSNGDNVERSLHQDIGTQMKATQFIVKKEVIEDVKGVLYTGKVEQDMLDYCNEQINDHYVVSASPKMEFSSPLQVTPIFRSLAAGIPSPEFSESEKYFLKKTLGVESPSIKTTFNPLKSPPCKRALRYNL
ncbi:transcription factor MYB88-like isoform X2 [Cicer arietinum]|uniref:Transcription factor MYB88-like isoform X2 n=1 Tax=Cicer arietinum TaxID=3827 RepID=A0A1S2YWV4_CICAR|nr:transcription factor MYB88-like isoform X2 [Cicer arietinum]